MKTIFTLTKSLNKTYVKDPKKFYSNFQNTHSKFFSSSIGNSNSNTSNSLKHNTLYNDMIESHIKSIRSTKPLMKDQMQLLFTNNNKIFIDLEEPSVHLALLNYIDKLNSDDQEVTNKKGKLVEIFKEKEKYYSINIMDMIKFKIDQKILNSIRKNLESFNFSKNFQMKIYFDGGCANKDRLGFFGCSFYINDQNLIQLAGNIGPNNTNNTSEYFGLVISLIFLDLLRIKDFKISNVKIFSDSELVCRQVQGRYKINTPHILILNSIVKNILKKFETKIEINHVLREFNEEADKLANIGKTFENNCFVVNY